MQAIVGTREMLGEAHEHGLSAVVLSDTLLMVPLSDEVRRRLQFAAIGLGRYRDTDAWPTQLD